MDAVPEPMPVTRPVEGAAVATAVLPLLQVPPGVASLRMTVPPAAHILTMPSTGDGAGLIVTVFVVLQPPLKVYVIVAVPASTPLTIPLLIPTVAVVVALLVHVPPPTSLN